MTAGAAEIADAALDPAADATVEALALCFALVASCYIIPALAARCSLTHAASQLLPVHCPRPVVPAPCSPCCSAEWCGVAHRGLCCQGAMLSLFGIHKGL